MTPDLGRLADYILVWVGQMSWYYCKQEKSLWHTFSFSSSWHLKIVMYFYWPKLWVSVRRFWYLGCYMCNLCSDASTELQTHTRVLILASELLAEGQSHLLLSWVSVKHFASLPNYHDLRWRTIFGVYCMSSPPQAYYSAHIWDTYVAGCTCTIYVYVHIYMWLGALMHTDMYALWL